MSEEIQVTNTHGSPTPRTDYREAMFEGLNDDWEFSLCRQLARELNEAIAELEWERANQRERQRIRDEALLIEREARDAELWRVRAEAEAEGDAAAAALAEERAKAEREAAASAAARAAYCFLGFLGFDRETGNSVAHGVYGVVRPCGRAAGLGSAEEEGRAA